MIETTVVIVPRESFNKTADVARRIFRDTHYPFKLLIMEGAAPKAVRAELAEIEREHENCQIVYSDHWLLAHEAANKAMPLIDTKYAVFIDNDVEVGEHWLAPLVETAQAKQAHCVHPIYLTEAIDSPNRKIHVAEGTIITEQRGEERYLDTIMTYSGEPVADYPNKTPVKSDYFEWHCVLFTKELLDKIGPLDDMNIAEHVDYSLRIQEAGYDIWLEPRSVVAYEYDRIFEFRKDDRRYFLYRWDVKRAKRSLDLLRRKWKLSADSTSRRFYWVNEHTGRVRNTFFVPRAINKIRRSLGMPNLPYTRMKMPPIPESALAAHKQASKAGE